MWPDHPLRNYHGALSSKVTTSQCVEVFLLSSSAKKLLVILKQWLATCVPSQAKCSSREQNAYVPELAGVAELQTQKFYRFVQRKPRATRRIIEYAARIFLCSESS